MKLWSKALAAIGLAALSATLPLQAAQAQQAETVKVALHWNAPNAAFIPYYVAIKEGFYKQEGLNVELQALPGSVPAVTAVSNGDAQFGQAGSDAVLVGIARKAPLKVIFLLYQSTPTGVVVFKDKGIKGIADLKGKTISTSAASPEAIILQARLREAGLNPDKDVKILNVAPGAKLTMMLTGQADTSTGFVNFQFIQAQMQGKEVAFVPFSTKEQPLYGHAIFANSKWLEGHEAVAKKFLAATMKGILWARDNVDKSVDIAVNWDPSLKVDREFIKRDWQTQLSSLIGGGTAATKGLGHMEDAGWVSLAKMLAEGNMLPAVPEAKEIYTNALIPADAPKWP